MVSTGVDQFWDSYKPEDSSVVTPKKKKPITYSQVSSMSPVQGTTVDRTNTAMSDAARRRLKKMQQTDLDS
jgi:hypothetical protein